MPHTRKTAPPAADPRAPDPGYAETLPRDREDARQPAPGPVPNPDDPGMEYDADAPPDPAEE